jgi:hypothetical protein
VDDIADFSSDDEQTAAEETKRPAVVNENEQPNVIVID